MLFDHCLGKRREQLAVHRRVGWPAALPRHRPAPPASQSKATPPVLAGSGPAPSLARRNSSSLPAMPSTTRSNVRCFRKFRSAGHRRANPLPRRSQQSTAPVSAGGYPQAPDAQPRRSFRRAACCALAPSICRTHFGVQRDLDVDLIIRTIDAGAVVDKVGVDAPAAQGEADTPCLRDARDWRLRR